jgi:nicotinate-nucleotide adenylyltransferase
MIGLLGGRFDPVHCGHLDVARAAIRALGLERVWLMPSRLPPHRTAPVASAAHRFAMVAFAVAGEPRMMVSDVEMDTPGPSYTVDTLDRLEARGVSARSVCFITGADAFCDVPSWKAYPALLDRCHFAVISRPGRSAATLRRTMPALAGRMIDAPAAPGDQPAIYLVDAATAPISSTEIRQAAGEHRPLAGLVPPAVAAHLERHDLYAPAPSTRNSA